MIEQTLVFSLIIKIAEIVSDCPSIGLLVVASGIIVAVPRFRGGAQRHRAALCGGRVGGRGGGRLVLA